MPLLCFQLHREVGERSPLRLKGGLQPLNRCGKLLTDLACFLRDLLFEPRDECLRVLTGFVHRFLNTLLIILQRLARLFQVPRHTRRERLNCCLKAFLLLM